MRPVVLLAGACTVALALAAAVLARDGEPTLPCSELPGRALPALDDRHIPHADADHEPYNSVPPTSGPHVPFTVAPGPYREEIDEEIQTHALEHGHVLLQYAPGTPRSQVDALEDVARRNPRHVVVAPYGRLERGIALTAWTRIERLPAVDDARVERFVDAVAGRYKHGWRDGARPCGGV